MLSIGGATPIAEEKEFAALSDCVGASIDQLSERHPCLLTCRAQDRLVLGEGLIEVVLEIQAAHGL